MLDKIKGYVVKEEIGSGSFGNVYRAERPVIGGDVAIKVINVKFANQPDFIRRFEYEAQLVAHLDHLHIVPLHTYWRDDEGAYLVMRWLRGGSLKLMLQQDKPPLQTVGRIINQICAALDHAHRMGVVHRDLKPANILFDEDGNAYVADFGIAKAVNTDQMRTDSNVILGTVGYTAPEQIRSEEVSSRADIYSLGVILYEMLTGEHPFPNLNAVEQIYKSLNDPVPLITTLGETIADAVNEVVQTAAAKDPAKRFESALELAAAFRDAVVDVEKVGPGSVIELLTPREHDILGLMVEGKSNQEIANTLIISKHTVKWYNNQIYKKLKVRNRVQAIIKAREMNLIVREQPEPADDATYLADVELPNPYKGLNAFQTADEKDFFGRTAITQKLVKRLQEDVVYRRFLTIVGPSGSGKSSLVKAGLIPALLRGKIPGSESWFIVDMMPGAEPIDELEVALVKIAADQGANIAEHLRRDARGLVRAGNLILPDDEGSELVIVIDQFEEVFTLVEYETMRSHFLDLIYHAVTDKRSRVRIVTTLRADFYDRPLQYPQIGDLVRERMETLLPLSAEELEQAITQPAARLGVTFEAGLVAAMIAEINYQAGALPLLQYALTELFASRDGRVISRDAFQEVGGTVGALANRADELYFDWNMEGQMLIRQMFMRLVTPGEGTEDTRRRVRRDELEALTENHDLLDDVIDTFVQWRLLALDHDRATHVPTVEVAHEALIREWEALRGWLQNSREDIKIQRRLNSAARTWQDHAQDESFLVSGSNLQQFEEWADSDRLTLTDLERSFLDTSIAERERREAQAKAQAEREANLRMRARRVLQGLVAVFFIAAVISIALALEASRQQELAEEAEQKALKQAAIGLAAQAELQMNNGDQELAVLLGLEALEEYPYTWQAQNSLADIVSQYVPTRIIGTRADLGSNTSVYWVADLDKFIVANQEPAILIVDEKSGEFEKMFRLSSSSEHFTFTLDLHPTEPWIMAPDRGPEDEDYSDVIVWNVETDQVVRRLELDYGEITNLKWSPSGSEILVAVDTNEIVLLDAATATELRTFMGHTGQINGIRWSPLENQIASISDDGTARIWDAETAEILYAFEEHSEPVLDVEWSPDGQQLVTTGADGSVYVWSFADGTSTTQLIGNSTVMSSVGWSPDGTRVAALQGFASTDDCEILVWHIASPGRVERSINTRSPSCTDVVWNTNDQVTVSFAAHLRTYDLKSSLPAISDHFQWQAVWSPNGQYILSSSQEGIFLDEPEFPGRTRIWDVEIGEVIFAIDHEAIGTGVAWSPDGNYIAITSMAGSTRIFPAFSNQELSRNPYDVDWSFMVAWSPDSTLVLDSGSEYSRIWDPQTGEVLHQLPTTCWGITPTWSPDGSKVLLGCLITFPERQQPNGATVWDANTGDLLFRLAENTEPQSVDWSPDGTQIATIFQNPDTGLTRAIIWDAETGVQLHEVNGHGNSRPWEIAWSPDGRFIATGDDEGVVNIWDATTFEPVMTIQTPDTAFTIDWHPGGEMIMVTGHFSRTTSFHQIWTSDEALIDYAKACCVTRVLTTEERGRFGLTEPNQ